MDGQLDAGAELAASGPNLSLYAAFDGTWLYLATQGVGATSSLDHFVLADLDPSGSRAAPWAKAGTVAGWDYLLANEDGNNWCGWFDASEAVFSSASAVKASGTYLESALDLAALYGSLPGLRAHRGRGVRVAERRRALDPGARRRRRRQRGAAGVLRLAAHGHRRAGRPVRSPPLPTAPTLYQSSPNPARGSSTIRFFLPVRAEVTLSIYDVRGRLVRELARGPFGAGEHEVVWDGRDAHGRRAAAGIYFCDLRGPVAR